MSIDLSKLMPADPAAATQAALTPPAAAMKGSLILGIAGQVRQLIAEGREICNLTVGDFSPAHFRIPQDLSEGIQAQVAKGMTNYPPADGVPELKAAIADLYKRELGLDYGPAGVCVGSGARPPIYAAWALFVQPGDRTVSFLPMWNVGYYAKLFQADHVYVPTTAENNFFPTVAQAAEAMRGARMMVINSPLNPTGTAIDPEVLRGIAQALVDENARRGWVDGAVGSEPPCILLFDQVYWMLMAEGRTHKSPVQLVPACAPFVVHVDAVSKCFAGTGLRVGWAVLPPYLQGKMKALIGHMGAWAPKPEQLATADFLNDPDAVAAYMGQIRSDVAARLDRLYDGIQTMKAQGLPVDAIAPQGGIYLSLRVDLVGKGHDSNESVRRFLLEQAGVAVVPFQAFDMLDESGWFRMSVGACGLDEIDAALARIEAALRA